MSRTAWILLATTIYLALAATARADFPPPHWAPSLRAPTEEDYFRLEQQELMRSMGVPCGFGLTTFAPPLLIYVNEVPPTNGCEPAHRSLRGTYGMFHPQPYYILNPPPSVAAGRGRPPAGGIFYPQTRRTILTPMPLETAMPAVR